MGKETQGRQTFPKFNPGSQEREVMDRYQRMVKGAIDENPDLKDSGVERAKDKDVKEEEIDNVFILASTAVFVKNNVGNLCHNVPDWFSRLLEKLGDYSGDAPKINDDDIRSLRRKMIALLSSDNGDDLDFLRDKIKRGGGVDVSPLGLFAGFCRLNFDYLNSLCDSLCDNKSKKWQFERRRDGSIEGFTPTPLLNGKEKREARKLNSCFFEAAELCGRSVDPLEIIRKAIGCIRETFNYNGEIPQTLSPADIGSLGIAMNSHAARVVGIDRTTDQFSLQQAVLAITIRYSGQEGKIDGNNNVIKSLLSLIDFELQRLSSEVNEPGAN